jgi:hypothetical protein
MKQARKLLAIPSAVLALAATALISPASAQVTNDGVTFTSSFTGNILTLEIDAAGRINGWADALTIGALQIKNVGTFDSVVFNGPGVASSWTVFDTELDADGCTGGSHAGMNACASGSQLTLSDNMIFTYTFTGAGLDLTNPHVKVNFFGSGPDKVGSLLSMNVSSVPEPSSYAMMFLGLGLLGALKRFSRK